MYQAILVDDEEEVRSGIANMIDWARLGFAPPAQAENGREALDLIEEAMPDIVITDISMPLMDGLDLAGAIQERFPTVKTVILTGYDDFKFAQQAIRFGVADYLLKPVLPSDIEALLDKLRAQLDAEAAEKEDVDRLRRSYREALPLLREKAATSGKAAVTIQVAVPPSTSVTDCQNSAQSLLSMNNLIGIFASNSGSVDGILAATTDGKDLDKASGKYKNLVVVGFDAGKTLKNAVRQKWFYGAITQDPYQIGYLSVELAYKAYKGEAVSDMDTGCKFYDASYMDQPDIAQLLYD